MNCSIEPITISDHAPITPLVELGKETFFNYWRLNVSIPSDEMVLKELDNDKVSQSTLWEGGEATIRGN